MHLSIKAFYRLDFCPADHPDVPLWSSPGRKNRSGPRDHVWPIWVCKFSHLLCTVFRIAASLLRHRVTGSPRFCIYAMLLKVRDYSHSAMFSSQSVRDDVESLWVLSWPKAGRLDLHWCLMLHDVCACVNKEYQMTGTGIPPTKALVCAAMREICILSQCGSVSLHQIIYTFIGIKCRICFCFSKLIIIQSIWRRISTVSKINKVDVDEKRIILTACFCCY